MSPHVCECLSLPSDCLVMVREDCCHVRKCVPLACGKWRRKTRTHHAFNKTKKKKKKIERIFKARDLALGRLSGEAYHESTLSIYYSDDVPDD